MKYLKIFTDFVNDIEALSEAECGRLFRAMLEYASCGTTPELKGNERFIWGTAKKNIDNQVKSYQNKVNGIAIARNALSDIRGNQTDCDRLALISEQEKDKDKDKDKEYKKENTKRKKFVPPTLDEIKDYCRSRNNNVDAQKFFDYFTNGNWIDSEGKPVRNWKQKIITWETNAKPKKQTQTVTDYKPQTADFERIQKMLERYRGD